jgi:N-acetylneuraminate synthase
VVAYKLGSGDISWIEIAEYMATKQKPLLIATGASDLYDVERVYKACRSIHDEIVLMQCNTNYTALSENFKYINLNVLRSFKVNFPEAILGLSDHTSGHETVLGAITLGARVIEKHFTDDTSRKGPDHAFAMDPKAWKEMMKAARNLEHCLGDGIKRVEENEKDTVVVQRRSVCVSRSIQVGEVIQREDLTFLRPYPDGAYAPYEVGNIIGRTCLVPMSKGSVVFKEYLK